jgi:hypothetical protein
MRLSEIGVVEADLALAPFHAIADSPTLFNARRFPIPTILLNYTGRCSRIQGRSRMLYWTGSSSMEK